MCGVHLIIDKRNKINAQPIENMLFNSRHRGPDAASFLEINFQNNKIFIGNNRLKINDLSDNANMPFVSADENFIISFNGEIYNHQILRKQLENKYIFKTTSDTETLLYWLIEKGEEGIKELNGMFSFFFIDKIKKNIWVARDKMGMKPLYLFQDNDFIILSSEIKSILATGLVEKKLNSSQIPQYLNYRFAKSPQTFFQNIINVENGILYEWKNQDFYKKNNFTTSVIDSEKSTNLDEILYKTVQNYIHSDVNMGLFLSGGVDSTLLLALMQQSGCKSIPCFTISNNNLTKDVQYARLAAKQYGGEYNEINVDTNLLNNFQNFIEKVDQPLADSGGWLTYLLAEGAKEQRLKVMLSGAGADEMFGGYKRHEAFKKYLIYHHFFKTNIKVLKKISIFFPKQLRLVQKFIQQIDPNDQQTFINFTSLLPVFEKNIEINNIESLEDDLIKWALKYDQDNYLVFDILKITDQLAMQSSVEVRLPFLDQNIINYTQNLNGNYILKHGKKWLLKKVLTNKGGDIFTKRKKEGLGIPFGNWLFEKPGKEILSTLQNPASKVFEFVSFHNIQNIIKAHQLKKIDYTSEIYAIATLAIWLEIHF